jgi:acetate kinase
MKASIPGRILTMNTGSSTLKAAIYRADPRDRLVLSINLDRADSNGAQVTIKDESGKSLFDSRVRRDNPIENGGNQDALDLIFDWLDKHGYLTDLIAAGHRLVHGGVQFQKPLRITPEIFAELEQLVPLDPDHLPAALAGIHFVSQRLPELPQIACFDTAFHSSLPKVARMYALPRRFFDGGVRRFGFHGLSYEYIVGELRALDILLANGRVIVAHLGSGASMVALCQGKSVDTSMGFTPLEGLVMGTRSGDVDPGAIFYLLEQGKMSPADLDKCMNKESGLLGVSGRTADMRDLLEKASEDAYAAEAVELFCYRAKKYIGAYAAALGGVDLVVFTGGIGEKAAPVRQKICDGLEFLGIQIDPQRNQTNDPVISSPDSRVKVRVIETNEDLTIVRHVRNVLGQLKHESN